MANRFFAQLADVWKHLPLAEVLGLERPQHFWETHAGSASYAMLDDAERRYGVCQFVEAAPRFPALARSRYLHHLRAMNPDALGTYPGSALVAMLELGDSASYRFCDLDPGSVANLKSEAARLGLAERTEVSQADGMTVLQEALERTQGTIVAHIDPFDPEAKAPGGLSALELAAELIRRGHGLVYWYGFDRPGQRAWAFDTLSKMADTARLWCGDMMVASREAASFDGDLGVATTPGTGFGIVCANVSVDALRVCERLGEELARAYRGVPLPNGAPGELDFLVRRSEP